MAKQFRKLPHDLQAEKALISSIILDGSSFNEISDLNIQAEDFFNKHYGIVFEAAQNLYRKSVPIEYTTLNSEIISLGKASDLVVDGGTPEQFLLELIEDQASSINVYFYAKSVKDKAVLRKAIKSAQGLAEKGYIHTGEVHEYLTEFESTLLKLGEEKGGEAGTKNLADCLKEKLKELEDKDRANGSSLGVMTGFGSLDSKLSGLRGGQLIVAAGRPGMGKTCLGLNVAINVAKESKRAVAYFSLEMIASELVERVLAFESKIDSRRIKTKNFQEDDIRKLSSAIKELSHYPIYINDVSNMDIFKLQSECRKLKAEVGLGLVVIDYVQLMQSPSKVLSREQQIAEISRGLKQLAKELNCPVIALSQLNRSVEARPEKRPMVSDLRESGSLEQDADIVLLIFREDFYFPDTPEKGVAEIIVGKNRSGETGSAKLAWLPTYTSFANLSSQYQNESTQSF